MVSVLCVFAICSAVTVSRQMVAFLLHARQNLRPFAVDLDAINSHDGLGARRCCKTRRHGRGYGNTRLGRLLRLRGLPSIGAGSIRRGGPGAVRRAGTAVPTVLILHEH